MKLFKLAPLSLSALFLFAANIGLAARHAVVVGIDVYGRGTCNLANVNQGRSIRLEGSCPTEQNPDLRNAVSDSLAFEKLLRDRYRFATGEITVIRNGQATARTLLKVFREELIEKLTKGDSAIFFYSGHGTTVENVKTGEKQQALVPYDFLQGAYPILDLELGDLYKTATDKGIQLTMILDSCYSGGLARGNRARTMFDPRKIKTDKRKFDPEHTAGFGLLAAAQATQEASDSPKTFTQAMVEVIEQLPDWELSLTELAQLTGVRLLHKQDPSSLGAEASRTNVVGESAGRRRNTFTVISKATSGVVTINGGATHGLTPGSILSAEDGTGPPYKITEVRPNECDLRAMDPGQSPTAGTRFVLRHWQPKYETAMSIYMPLDLPSNADIRAISSCLPNAGPDLFRAPASEMQVGWVRNGWEIAGSDGTRRKFRCSDAVPRRSLSLTIPPTREIREALARSLGPYAQLLQNNQDAPFAIVGRLNDGNLEYSLIRQSGQNDGIVPRQTDWNSDWQVTIQDALPLAPPPDCVVRSVDCATILSRRIQRYRIALDLEAVQLTSTQLREDPSMPKLPFIVQLREKDGKTCSKRVVTEAITDKPYCLYLMANEPIDQKVKWYVQLFSVDGAGLQSVAFTDPATQYPEGNALLEREIRLLDDWSSRPTEGARETFVMIVSTRPLLDKPPYDAPYQSAPDNPNVNSRSGQTVREPGYLIREDPSLTTRGGNEFGWALSITTVKLREKK
jgi:hypothetical protein